MKDKDGVKDIPFLEILKCLEVWIFFGRIE